jgi:hypothetical protein
LNSDISVVLHLFFISLKNWSQNHLDYFLRFSLKTGGDGFFRFGFTTGGDGFFGLGLKTDSSGWVIWALKSPRRFLGLGLKTKQTSVYRLRHKTDGGRTAWTYIEI